MESLSEENRSFLLRVYGRAGGAGTSCRRSPRIGFGRAGSSDLATNCVMTSTRDQDWPVNGLLQIGSSADNTRGKWERGRGKDGEQSRGKRKINSNSAVSFGVGLSVHLLGTPGYSPPGLRLHWDG